MDVFTKIEGSVAITRHPKGVHKQSELYARGQNVYVRHAGGFVRIVGLWGTDYTTTHPDVKVVELEGEGVSFDKAGIRFKPVTNVRAVA